MAEKRRADEQTSAQEPHSGVQGEGGPGCSQGEKTLAELAEQFDIHPNQITQWKSSSQEGAAVVDWFSRRVLAWKLSITMETAFCIEALEDALARNEKPEIFNTDQGSRYRGPQRQVFVAGVEFTSEAFTGRLKKEGISISMDGKGRWRKNLLGGLLATPLTFLLPLLRFPAQLAFLTIPGSRSLLLFHLPSPQPKP
jgi:hypothetical protein